MNIKFQTMSPSYRTPTPAPAVRKPKAGQSKGNYDTVTIHGPQVSQEDSFAKILSRRAASSLSESASPERVQELSRQVSSGTYHPDADRIAGRLLGLN